MKCFVHFRFEPQSDVIAMSLTDSEPNFRARCNALGLSTTVTDALCTSGVGTIAKFAFSSSFVPGMQEERPFTNAMATALGRDPNLGELALLRRLLHECYALVSAELQSSVERVEDAPVKKLAQPERADRLKKQQAKLSGLRIVGKLEPSDRLIDRIANLYEENRISYIELTKCTSKEQEVLNSSIKEDKHVSIDSAGTVKVRDKDSKLEADISTDLMVRMALMRRGLALDQCNVLEYSLHDQWVEKVFDVPTETPTDGYSHISLQQVIQADRKLFLKLAELTREGIQVRHDGRPCDKVFLQATQHPDVLHLLQPLPVARVSKTAPTIEVVRDGPYHKGAGKGKKGKGKSSTFTGSTTIKMPAGLEGGVPATKNNNPICFDHNFARCHLPVSRGRCKKGLHICCVKACHKADHNYQDCPMRKKSS